MRSANSRTTSQEHKDDMSSTCSIHESGEESSISPQSADSSVHSRFSVPSSSSMSDVKKKSSSSRRGLNISTIPPTLLAQHFNNKGVKTMNIGDYRKASLLFSQAIKTYNDDGVCDYCTCHHCKISSCVRFSLQNDVQDSAVDTNENFVYTRGISVHPEAMGHKMGHALLQIATLNLAIARHLLFLEQPFNDRREQAKKFQKVSSLYKMAFQWHVVGESQGQDTVNIGFFLIIINNLGQIHRTANNHGKLSLCRDHMQSALMTILTNQETEWYQSLNFDGFFRTAFSDMMTCASAA